jgi:hypothetical protein
MRRLTAILLVASLSIQAASCTSGAPARPDLAARRDAPSTVRTQSSGAVQVDTRQSPTEVATAATPYPSASEFWSGQAGGLIVGVGLVAAIALAILVGGRSSSSNSTGGGTTGGTGTTTGTGTTGGIGTTTGTPSVIIQ